MTHTVTFVASFPGWQKAARAALLAGWWPKDVYWQESRATEPAVERYDAARPLAPAHERPTIRVPRAFVERGRQVACHRDARRWALLYRVLWRLVHGESKLLGVAADRDVEMLARFEEAVARNVDEMRVSLRFRPLRGSDDRWHAAWYEPRHRIVELAAPFFVERLATTPWSILTRDRCAHWNGTQLFFTAGIERGNAALEDLIATLRRTCESSIFGAAPPVLDATPPETAALKDPRSIPGASRRGP